MRHAASKKSPLKQSDPGKDFDLEMLYVECSRCGRPVIWEKGTTTNILQSSGIHYILGSEWLLLSSGCPSCSPEMKEFVLTLAHPASQSSNPVNGKFN